MPVSYKPDIYCLPETFLDPAQKSLETNAEDGSGKDFWTVPGVCKKT
jgi:hypothetical protein